MSQTYHFVSHWLIPASPATVDRLLFTSQASAWWPGLESMTVLDTDRHRLQRYRSVWRSQSGYRLTTIMTVTSHQAGRLVRFKSEGDLEGSGSFRLEVVEGGATKITINWDVCTTKAWMTHLAFILRPLFIKNHHKLMKDGERGLIQYIRQGNAATTNV